MDPTTHPVAAECAAQRESATQEITIQEAIDAAKWLERVGAEAVLSTDRARQVILALHAALQSSPCFYKGVREGIPTFTLLAYDKAGHSALGSWILEAEANGCRPAKVVDAINMLCAWKARHDLRWPT